MQKNKEWLAASAIFLFFLPVYLLTISQNFSFDALTNALAAESGDASRWFPGNHPFYPFLAVLWYKAESLFGYTGYSIYSMTRLNIFLAVFGLSYLTKMLCRYISPLQSVVVAFFMGSLFCIWNNAVDAFAIGASTSFSIFVISYLSGLIDNDSIPMRSLCVLSFLSALLTLVHGIAIFHIFVVTGWILFRTKPFDLKAALSYFIGALGLIGIAYILIYYVVVVRPEHPMGFLRWGIGYAAYDGVANMGKSPYWQFRFWPILQGLWNGWVNAFFFSLTSKLTLWMSYAIGALSIGATLISFRLVKKKAPAQRHFFWLLILWACTVSVFLSVWSPGASFYRIHVIIPVIVAWSLAFAGKPRIFLAQFAVAAVIFLVNFTHTMYPNAFLKNNAGYQALNETRGHLKPNDIIVCTKFIIPNVQGLRAYFFPEIMGGTIEGRLFEFHERDLRGLTNSLRRNMANGKSVYILDDVVNKHYQQAIEKDIPLPFGSIEEFLAQFQLNEAFRLTNGHLFYRATLVAEK